MKPLKDSLRYTLSSLPILGLQFILAKPLRGTRAMVSLLEEVARNNAINVSGHLLSYANEYEAVVTTPSPHAQAMRAIDVARFLTKHVPDFIDGLGWWVKEVETRLRTRGYNGNDFKRLISSGVEYLKSCQDLLMTATTICGRISSVVPPLLEQAELNQLATVVQHCLAEMKELESKVLLWKKIADRRSPDLTPEVLEGVERGKKQIEQGKFKTTKQILEEIRSRKPSQ